ncbi:hypothetical protein BSKO_08758 [Bryopsis sp. KO-2023]|nr:hypothetical protein BSKO_08758 [Bryopsis sp. KO-2023]
MSSQSTKSGRKKGSSSQQWDLLNGPNFRSFLRKRFWLLVSASILPHTVIPFVHHDLAAIALLPKLVRLVLVYEYFRSKEMELGINVRHVAFIKFFVLVFGTAHWSGCMFYFLARLSNFSSTEGEESWIRLFPEDTGLDFVAGRTSTLKAYIVMLYKGFNCLTNLGYDSYIPQRPEEFILQILVINVQIVMAAYILGTLFHYLVKTDAMAEAFRLQLRALNSYCQHRNLPSNLRDRLRKYFEFQHEKVIGDDSKILKALPASLKMKVAEHDYSTVLLQNKSLFRNCNAQFLVHLMANIWEMHVMPKEVLLREGDMGELFFLKSGTVNVFKGEKQIRTLVGERGGANVAGKISFFIGVPQPFNYVASNTRDATVLVMNRLNYDQVVSIYHEDHDIVVGNILFQFGLDKDGEEIANGGNPDEIHEEEAKLKEGIQADLRRRKLDASTALTYAAEQGDVELVSNLINQGCNIGNTNYDDRSALHVAASEGQVKVVSVLVQKGVGTEELMKRDRWNLTPLHCALMEKHHEVVQMLLRTDCAESFDDPTTHLIRTAAEGDIPMLRLIVQAGIDINSRDYDQQTCFHVAAKMGWFQVVDFLLDYKADINLRDRWGHTPLMYAIEAHQELTANLIRENGGWSDEEWGVRMLLNAAWEGDVQKLRLLAQKGMPGLDTGDYDRRTALHFAARSGQIVAADFLINACHCKVNVPDRWNRTPLEEALMHNHFKVACLIKSAGGIICNEDSMPLLENAFANIQQVRMEVRELTEEIVSDPKSTRISTTLPSRNVDVRGLWAALHSSIESLRIVSPALKDQHQQTTQQQNDSGTLAEEGPVALWLSSSRNRDSSERRSPNDPVIKRLHSSREKSSNLESDSERSLRAFNATILKFPLVEKAVNPLLIVVREFRNMPAAMTLTRLLEVLDITMAEEQKSAIYNDTITMKPGWPTDTISISRLLANQWFRETVMDTMDAAEEDTAHPNNTLEALRTAMNIVDDVFAILDTAGDGFIEIAEIDRFQKRLGWPSMTEVDPNYFGGNEELDLADFYELFMHWIGSKELEEAEDLEEASSSNVSWNSQDFECDLAMASAQPLLAPQPSAAPPPPLKKSLSWKPRTFVAKKSRGQKLWDRVWFRMKCIFSAAANIELRVDDVMKRIDSNNDNMIQSDELRQGIEILQSRFRGLTEAELLKLADKIDVENDGVASKETLGKYLEPFQASPGSEIDMPMRTQVPNDASPLVVYPHWPMLRIWDRIIGALAIYIFFDVPFKLAFVSHANHSCQADSCAIMRVATAVDILLAMDMVLRFFRAYYDKKSVLIYSLGDIRHNYLGLGAERIWEEANVAKQYLLGFYWITATLSTSGLVAETLPKNTVELCFVCCLMFVSLTLYAYILGSISDLVMKQDEALVGRREHMMLVQNFVRNRDLPLDLTKEIQTFFDMTMKNDSDADGEKDIFMLLSFSLQIEVARYISWELLTETRIFRQCNENFLASVSVLVREVNINPDTYLFRENEDAVVPQNTFCACFVLKHEDYKQLIKLYPDAEELVHQNALGDLSSIRNQGRKRLDSDNSGHSGETCISEFHGGASAAQVSLDLARKRKELERTVQVVYFAANGDLEGLQRFLGNHNVDVDRGDSLKRTALHLASSNNHIDVAQFLVNDCNVDINAQDKFGFTPLSDAIRHQHKGMIYFLQSKGGVATGAGNCQECALAADGNLSMLKIVLSCGANPNQRDSRMRTPLHLAASNGHLEIVEYLCSLPGIDVSPVDDNNGTPLEDAIRHQHVEIEEFLRGKGAQLLRPDVDMKLCTAAAMNDVETLKMFRDNGVDMNTVDHAKRTPLHLAAGNRSLEAVAFLLKVGGVDVNPVDIHQCTPYDDAVREGDPVVRALLESHGGVHGSNISSKDLWGKVKEALMASRIQSLAYQLSCYKIEIQRHCDVFEDSLRSLIFKSFRREEVDDNFSFREAVLLRTARTIIRKTDEYCAKMDSKEAKGDMQDKLTFLLCPDLNKSINGLRVKMNNLKGMLIAIMEKMEEEGFDFPILQKAEHRRLLLKGSKTILQERNSRQPEMSWLLT